MAHIGAGSRKRASDFADAQTPLKRQAMDSEEAAQSLLALKSISTSKTPDQELASPVIDNQEASDEAAAILLSAGGIIRPEDIAQYHTPRRKKGPSILTSKPKSVRRQLRPIDLTPGGMIGFSVLDTPQSMPRRSGRSRSTKLETQVASGTLQRREEHGAESDPDETADEPDAAIFSPSTHAITPIKGFRNSTTFLSGIQSPPYSSLRSPQLKSNLPEPGEQSPTASKSTSLDQTPAQTRKSRVIGVGIDRYAKLSATEDHAAAAETELRSLMTVAQGRPIKSPVAVLKSLLVMIAVAGAFSKLAFGPTSKAAGVLRTTGAEDNLRRRLLNQIQDSELQALGVVGISAADASMLLDMTVRANEESISKRKMRGLAGKESAEAFRSAIDLEFVPKSLEVRKKADFTQDHMDVIFQLRNSDFSWEMIADVMPGRTPESIRIKHNRVLFQARGNRSRASGLTSQAATPSLRGSGDEAILEPRAAEPRSSNQDSIDNSLEHDGDVSRATTDAHLRTALLQDIVNQAMREAWAKIVAAYNEATGEDASEVLLKAMLQESTPAAASDVLGGYQVLPATATGPPSVYMSTLATAETPAEPAEARRWHAV